VRLLTKLPTRMYPVIFALLSFLPGAVVLFAAGRYARRVRSECAQQRTRLFTALGTSQPDVGRKKVIGFFHPYW
jgi:hypothetical protein